MTQLENQLKPTLEKAGLNELYWIHGFITSEIRNREKNPIVNELKSNTIDSTNLTSVNQTNQVNILFGSHGGNGKKIAKRLQTLAAERGFAFRLTDMAEYNFRNIKSEEILLIIVSTHGEGTPPIAAEDFYNFIYSKKAPKLDQLKYSVLALGDKSYINYCKTGKDFDSKLAELGAHRLNSLIECDINFYENSEKWIETILEKLTKTQSIILNPSISINQPITYNTKSSEKFTRSNPSSLILTEKIKLNGRGSKKETFHLEFIDPDSTISYNSGDSLAIYPENNEELVKSIISKTSFDETKMVSFNQIDSSLFNILLKHTELNLLNREVLENYQLIAKNSELEFIINDQLRLSKYLYGRDLLDLLTDFPIQIYEEEFIAILQPIRPRLYSISSSINYAPGEIHLTVGNLNYTFNNRIKSGTCSSYLTRKLDIDASITAYIDENESFRLPADPSQDIIMIGPGTGIAPFRSFMQEREIINATGKNWLFFGDRNFTTDFLYQTEWQQWHKNKLLTNITLAFSRDTNQKIYVQHKMQEHATELFNWIENGASLYVCGDKNKMANDVYQTFINIVKQKKAISEEDAKEYVKQLKKQKRYLEDVY